MQILIIEDEQKTAAFLQKGLSEQGFTVDAAYNGDDGLLRLKDKKYDICILDVMLPGKDGWAVIAAMKDQKTDTPVIFLTAKDTVADRVKGLELGADDYLVKPFAFSELLARVKSVIRRSPSRQTTLLKIADLELDLTAHRVTRAGKRLDLTPKEFALLSLLMRRMGEVLSRNLIAEQVWDMAYNADSNVVDVHIRRLRMKLDDPFDRKLLHTVRGVGYMIEDRG